MKLLVVVLCEGEQRLEAVVEEADGTKRRIAYRWLMKDATDTPPDIWYVAVQAEVDLQRAQDLARKTGRALLP